MNYENFKYTVIDRVEFIEFSFHLTLDLITSCFKDILEFFRIFFCSFIRFSHLSEDLFEKVNDTFEIACQFLYCLVYCPSNIELYYFTLDVFIEE